LPVELLRALENRGAPAYRVDSAGPDGICLVAASFPSIHLFARGENLVARCAGVEHAAPLWSLDRLAAVLMPAIAAPLPDLRAQLRKTHRAAARKLKPPRPPLTAEQQADVERLRPKAIAIARRKGNGQDVIAQALLALSQAVQDYDGRMSLDAFTLERVEQRVKDFFDKEGTFYRHHNKYDPRQQSKLVKPAPEATPDCAIHDDPTRRPRLAESAAAVRDALDLQQKSVLRLIADGLDNEEIARRENRSVRRVEQIVASIRRTVGKEAREAKLPAKALLTVTMDLLAAARSAAVKLLGDDAEEAADANCDNPEKSVSFSGG
jgi:RNA polymerase sigma factor (sigma-70 family)